MKSIQSYQPIRISKREFEWVILVVEDDPVTSLMIRKMLAHNGYTCKASRSGQETLKILQEIKNPILVLLDYSLPDMTARELVEIVHANKIDISFIVVAAHKQTDIAVDMMKLGALDFIAKDDDFLDLLIHVVKNALKKLQTERLLLQTEKAIRETEIRYFEFFENIKSAVAVFQPINGGRDFIFVDINSTAEKIDKIKKELIVGKNIKEVYPAIQEYKLWETMSKVNQDGKPRKLPVYFYEDGRLSSWRENQIYKLSSGEIVFVYDDVSEKKLTEKKLKEQNDFMVSILESISHPFYVINVDDFSIEIANSAARKNNTEKKISCYALAHDFAFPCNSLDQPCPIEMIKKSGKPVVVEHTHVHNGKQKIFEVHAYPIFDSDGNLSKIIEYTNDITERRRLVMEIVEISQKERNEIGLDLHDSLGQQLTGISFLAGVLEQTLRDESRTETELAAKVSNLLTNAIEHTRAIARGLSPVEMELDGFIVALEQLVENFSKFYPVSIDFKKKGLTLLYDNRVATQLYYIAQEALNNSLKHSGANKIDFLADFQKETIYLEISDNGKGISRSSKKDRGLGLRIMEYRARLIGATLAIEKMKNGTKIICSLNL